MCVCHLFVNKESSVTLIFSSSLYHQPFSPRDATLARFGTWYLDCAIRKVGNPKRKGTSGTLSQILVLFKKSSPRPSVKSVCCQQSTDDRRRLSHCASTFCTARWAWRIASRGSVCVGWDLCNLGTADDLLCSHDSYQIKWPSDLHIWHDRTTTDRI